ncbi:hypothetical protein V6Z12_A11G045800 [Gossypium hirsutum]
MSFDIRGNQETQQSLTLSLKGYSGIWVCKSLLLGVAVEVRAL